MLFCFRRHFALAEPHLHLQLKKLPLEIYLRIADFLDEVSYETLARASKWNDRVANRPQFYKQLLRATTPILSVPRWDYYRAMYTLKNTHQWTILIFTPDERPTLHSATFLHEHGELSANNKLDGIILRGTFAQVREHCSIHYGHSGPVLVVARKMATFEIFEDFLGRFTEIDAPAETFHEAFAEYLAGPCEDFWVDEEGIVDFALSSDVEQVWEEDNTLLRAQSRLLALDRSIPLN